MSYVDADSHYITGLTGCGFLFLFLFFFLLKGFIQRHCKVWEQKQPFCSVLCLMAVTFVL